VEGGSESTSITESEDFPLSAASRRAVRITSNWPTICRLNRLQKFSTALTRALPTTYSPCCSAFCPDAGMRRLVAEEIGSKGRALVIIAESRRFVSA
jgi:hypothetical protein